MTVRSRFAPSPTGDLHVGGARTALFSWLIAQQAHGVFILRIEDTDLERSKPEFVERILEAMAWLGLPYQEGPYFQTQRFDRYRLVITQLLEEGYAYRCNCSKERLEVLREAQMARKEKPRYDGHCRDKQINVLEPHVIRFKNPMEGSVVWEDLVKGRIEIANSELDDLIIARTDGVPTYNLTVVVDDYDMKITHVVRGDDHVNNTPRQINLLKALKAPVPQYAHVSMILGEDGQRLSKRHGAVSVMEYRRLGYLPEALLNYLLRLGFSQGDQEIFSRQQMIEMFSLESVNSAPASFNYSKLRWLNQHYLKHSSLEVLMPELIFHYEQQGVDYQNGPSLESLLPLFVERVHTLVELVEQTRYFYTDTVEFESGSEKHFGDLTALKVLRDRLYSLAEWTPEKVHSVLSEVATSLQLGMGKVAMPFRVAITGRLTSPSIDKTAALIGRVRVIARLDKVLGNLAACE